MNLRSLPNDYRSTVPNIALPQYRRHDRSFQLLDFYCTLVMRRIEIFTPQPSCRNSIAGTSAMRERCVLLYDNPKLNLQRHNLLKIDNF
jgi:hypothetical protein